MTHKFLPNTHNIHLMLSLDNFPPFEQVALRIPPTHSSLRRPVFLVADDQSASSVSALSGQMLYSHQIWQLTSE
ncbi:MAG TPA: hypothetical protein V6D31_03060 [Candidatus Sericytochromatia bacterium]